LPLDDAYSWIKFVHVLGVLGFLAAHGASVTVSFKMRGEHDRERVRALLDVSGAYLSAMYGSLLVLVLAGVAVGLLGGWFTKSLWIWVALALLFGIMVAMYYFGTAHFSELRKAAGLPYAVGSRRPIAGRTSLGGGAGDPHLQGSTMDARRHRLRRDRDHCLPHDVQAFLTSGAARLVQADRLDDPEKTLTLSGTRLL